MIRSNLKTIIARKEVETGRRLSYELLAKEVGLSKNTINQLAENETTMIAFRTLDRLCAYFGVEVGDILERVGD